MAVHRNLMNMNGFNSEPEMSGMQNYQPEIMSEQPRQFIVRRS